MEDKRLWMVYLFVLMIFLSGEHKGGEATLPPIDPQVIIAGLKHTESLLQTGKCRIHYQGYSKLANFKEEHEDIFAFDSYRIYRFSLSGLILNGKYVGGKDVRELYDTKTQTKFAIGKKMRGEIPVRIDRGINSPFNHSWDPRNYGMRISGIPSTPLSELLRKNGARIVKVEKIKRSKESIPCYVVDSKDRIWGKIRLWLDPKEGFLPIKIRMGDRWFMNINYKPYRSDGQTVWFLDKGLWWSVDEKGNIVEKRIMEVKEFQPNVDISDLFRVDLPPDTPVWDSNLSKYRPFKEIAQELKEIGLITE